jgi:hypothetical protein
VGDWRGVGLSGRLDADRPTRSIGRPNAPRLRRPQSSPDRHHVESTATSPATPTTSAVAPLQLIDPPRIRRQRRSLHPEAGHDRLPRPPCGHNNQLCEAYFGDSSAWRLRHPPAWEGRSSPPRSGITSTGGENRALRHQPLGHRPCICHSRRVTVLGFATVGACAARKGSFGALAAAPSRRSSWTAAPVLPALVHGLLSTGSNCQVLIRITGRSGFAQNRAAEHLVSILHKNP